MDKTAGSRVLDELDDPAYFEDFEDFDDFDDWDLDLGAEYDPPEVEPPSLAVLAACTFEERTCLIDTYVRQELSRVLRVPPHEIDTVGRPMNSLGIGSINGLELQRRMEAALQVGVDLQRLLRANSAAELIDCLAGQLGPEDSPHKHGDSLHAAAHAAPGVL
ncbi:acyl carrier protein [Streptomyces bambusae]|uniref:acyl carrier protein n=1 Tax=Streptomyces bambusae TaxID=1550616 RepID=UPI001CFFD7A5|nr:acyl carrier protein [Streptomyces bambusae]MCB5170200.1 acyl carrier protein [Streptomyces bambusae]